MSAEFTFSKIDLLKRVFDIYKRHAVSISFIFVFIFSVLWVLGQFYSYYFYFAEDFKIRLLAFLLYFIANIYSGISIIYLSLNIDRGTKIKLAEFLNLFNKFLSFILLVFTFTSMFYLGILFFVAPALWVLATFSFAPYILIDRNYSVFKSFYYSYKISKGHRVNILIFYIILFILNFLAALSVFGLLVSVPLTVLSVAYLYQVLSCMYERKESKDRCGVKIKIFEFWQKFWIYFILLIVSLLGVYSVYQRIKYWGSNSGYVYSIMQQLKSRIVDEYNNNINKEELESITILQQLKDDIDLFIKNNGRPPNSLEELNRGYENTTIIYIEHEHYFEVCDSVSFICFQVKK